MNFFDGLKNEKSKNLYFDKVYNHTSDNAIVFLHGLTGSRRYWNKNYHVLAKNSSLYFVDLLGFGYSAKPDIEYSLQSHTMALEKFVKEHVKEKSLTFIGHSIGAIIALSYAKQHSNNIHKLYLLSLPYFLTEEDAIAHAKKTIKPAYFIEDTVWTKLTCRLFCYFGGPVSRRFGYLLLKKYPKEVANDGFLHTYNSYISTLYNICFRQNIPLLLTKNSLNKKIVLMHGVNDEIAPLRNVGILSRMYRIYLHRFSGHKHTLPIDASGEIARIILKEQP